MKPSDQKRCPRCGEYSAFDVRTCPECRFNFPLVESNAVLATSDPTKPNRERAGLRALLNRLRRH